MNYRTEAIILESKDVKEVDRLYTIFSKEFGKKKIIGVGTRKITAKLASGLEPFTKVELFLIKCRGLDKVTGVLILNQYPHLKKNFELILEAKKTAWILERIVPEKDASTEIYKALKFYLKSLDKTSKEKDKELRAKVFQLALLWKTIIWCGYETQFFNCVDCGKSLRLSKKYFFTAPRGFFCDDCFSRNKSFSINVSQEGVKVLRLFLGQKIEIVSKIKTDQKTVREVNQVTKKMLESVLNRRVDL